MPLAGLVVVATGATALREDARAQARGIALAVLRALDETEQDGARA